MLNYLFVTLIAFTVLRCEGQTAKDVNRKRNDLPSICFNQDGVLVPMPGSCSGFFICINGNAIASSCGDFYHFNARTGHCDDPSNAACFNYVPLHAEHILNEPHHAPSAPTIQPNRYPHLPKPKYPEEVVADLSAGSICQGRETGALLHKMDSCTQYYVCIWERPYRRTCPPMLHFNATRHLCQDPALANCITHFQIVPNATDPIVDIDSSNEANNELSFESICNNVSSATLLQHPAECHKFIYCTNREAKELLCPLGLHFSLRHQRCEWPSRANCTLPTL